MAAADIHDRAEAGEVVRGHHHRGFHFRDAGHRFVEHRREVGNFLEPVEVGLASQRCDGGLARTHRPRRESGASARNASPIGVSANRRSPRCEKNPWLASRRNSRYTASGCAPTRSATASAVCGPSDSASTIPSFVTVYTAWASHDPVMMSSTFAVGGWPAISWWPADYRCGRPPPNGPAMMTSPMCCPCGCATCRGAHRRVRTTMRSGRE